ncbi:MAG: hypothetical protein LW878_13110 [Proteobacteria bacterium]|nr:hypothetical protein [Pseudomonadota bacterium]
MESQRKPSDFLYQRRGPWPQPCPEHPFGEAPAVLHLPLRETIDWWFHIGSRYLRTLLSAPLAYLRGIIQPGLQMVSDRDFNDYLTKSMMAKFIRPEFDDEDRRVFGDLIKSDSLVVDLQAVRVVKTFDGIWVCPSKVLLEKTAYGWQAQCIHLQSSKELFYPNAGASWELAKYFVLQGAALCATLVVHPLLHFPLDAINAITKTALPKDHLLFQLLLPHTRFTLYLEKAVLTFKSSLLHGKWWMPYAPYPGPYEGLRDLLVEGYAGIEQNVNYPAYQYQLECPKIFGSYGEYHRRYYRVVQGFVDAVLANLSKEEWVYALHWVHYIHAWLPGFPSRESVASTPQLLNKIVTSYLFNVTIGHTIDHYNYGRMNIRQVPLRLRTPPPSSPSESSRVDPSRLTRFWDNGKYEMASKLFFSSSTKTSLLNTHYDFGDRQFEIQRLVDEFKLKLQQTEADLTREGINYMPLCEVAASIQF